MRIEYDNKNRAGARPCRVRNGYAVRFGPRQYRGGHVLYLTEDEMSTWSGRVEPVQDKPKQKAQPVQELADTQEQAVLKPAKTRRRRPAGKRRSGSKPEA